MKGNFQMDEPIILKFPAPPGQPATSAQAISSPASGAASAAAPSASAAQPLSMADADLQTILQAWNEATDRLQETH